MCLYGARKAASLLVSIRDCRHSKKDRQWIQEVYPEYLDALADLNTGLFSVLGASNPHQDEIFANWFSNDHSHPLVISKGPDAVGFALVSRPRVAAGRRGPRQLPYVGVLRPQAAPAARASAGMRPSSSSIGSPATGKSSSISATQRRDLLAAGAYGLLQGPLHGALPERRGAPALHQPAGGGPLKRRRWCRPRSGSSRLRERASGAGDR